MEKKRQERLMAAKQKKTARKGKSSKGDESGRGKQQKERKTKREREASSGGISKPREKTKVEGSGTNKRILIGAAKDAKAVDANKKWWAL